MKAVYALYWTPESAQKAVNALKAAGIAEDRIAVQSSEPLEEYEFGQRDRATWMPWIAVCGGVIGMVAAYLLTSVTQQSWPIDTGGMPIVTSWPNLIVIFELTMLGAVLATVLTLLVSARLPGKRPQLYDPEIANGKILIGVANPQDAELVVRTLRASGRAAVKTME
jgi:hypothetical protein